MMRRIPLSFALMAVGIYIVVPTPDELLLHPVMGLIFSKVFGVSLQTGIVWSCTMYTGLGLVFLAGSILLGGRIVVHELNNKVSSGTSSVIKGIDEKSSHLLHAMSDHAFSDTAEAERVLESYIFDY
jgi:hypothetical protein